MDRLSGRMGDWWVCRCFHRYCGGDCRASSGRLHRLGHRGRMWAAGNARAPCVPLHRHGFRERAGIPMRARARPWFLYASGCSECNARGHTRETDACQPHQGNPHATCPANGGVAVDHPINPPISRSTDQRINQSSVAPPPPLKYQTPAPPIHLPSPHPSSSSCRRDRPRRWHRRRWRATPRCARC